MLEYMLGDAGQYDIPGPHKHANHDSTPLKRAQEAIIIGSCFGLFGSASLLGQAYKALRAAVQLACSQCSLYTQRVRCPLIKE